MRARASDGREAADRLRTIVPGRDGLGVDVARRLIRRTVLRWAIVSDPKVRNCRARPRQAVTCLLTDAPPGDLDRRERWVVRRARDGIIHATVLDLYTRDRSTYELQP